MWQIWIIGAFALLVNLKNVFGHACEGKLLCFCLYLDGKGRKSSRWVEARGMDEDPTFIPDVPAEWECKFQKYYMTLKS